LIAKNLIVAALTSGVISGGMMVAGFPARLSNEEYLRIADEAQQLAGALVTHGAQA
jgi:hypothetical protein